MPKEVKNCNPPGNGWKRISPCFSKPPEDVKDLKECILQNAVMGKLVSHDPNDEPASELLKKIAEEKAELVRKKEIKKQQPLPEITDNEKPFEIPKGWAWCRFQKIFSSIRYGTSKKCHYNKGAVPVLRIPNISNGGISQNDLKYSDLTPKEIEDLSLERGDLLIIRSNGSESLVGRSSIVDKAAEPCSFAGYLMRIRPSKANVDSVFIHYSLESPYVRKAIEFPIRTTSGVKNINSTEVSQLIIPLPPLNEQKQIAKKIQSLISLCDAFQIQLVNSRKVAEQLAKSIIESITGISTEKKENMKAPKTELITKLKLVKKPGVKDKAPLSALLAQNNDELSAKTLWTRSGLTIDAFYRQLKTEMVNGWIEESQKAEVHILKKKG